MKSVRFFMACMVGLVLISCTDVREKTVEEMLEKPKIRDEVYSAIIKDSLYFKMLMGKIMSNENSKEMLAENHEIMKMMCMSDNMHHLMNTDKEVREKVTSSFMLKMEEKTAVCDKTCVKYMPSEHYKKCIKEQICSQ